MAATISRLVARWWSVALACVLAVLVVIELSVADRPAFGIVIVLVAIAVLGAARWHPVAAAYAALAVFLVASLANANDLWVMTTAGFVAVATCSLFGSLCDLRDRLVGLASALGVLTVVVARAPAATLEAEGASRAGALISNVILFTVGWAVTWAVTSRVRLTRQLRARAARLQEERDQAAAEAVSEERARIARELHDVVAHSVSVMTVQAGGVRRLLKPEQTREREALSAIEETGRHALTEMRRMVSVMRGDGAASPTLEPQPGVATLARLVEEVRSAGLPVALEVDDDVADLPPGVDLSVYRIVQEGLTNALRHAGPAHAEVSVRLTGKVVEILVEDDGRGGVDGEGGGHGLVGMRERVPVYGGDLEAGPRPGGGFRLRAHLPFELSP